MEHRFKLEPGCEKEEEERYLAASRQHTRDVVIEMCDWRAPEERRSCKLKPERAAERGLRDKPAIKRGRREKPTVERRLPTKLPSFDGTSSWEVFNAQMGVMEKLCGWTPEEKVQQLTAELREEAQMVLLNLVQEEWGDLNALTAALQHRFSSMGDRELLRARFRRRVRSPGESLAKLGSNLEWDARCAYADSPAREQEEQARFQFVEAVGPGELRKHLRLAKPRFLQDVLQLAHEWEDISKEEDEHRSQPAVRATEVEVGPDQSRLGLAEVMEEIEAIRKAMAARLPPSPHFCWECGQPGHIRVDCPRRWRRADSPTPALAPSTLTQASSSLAGIRASNPQTSECHNGKGKGTNCSGLPFHGSNQFLTVK
ncbi:UNVERIFIED_CONTAM: hypothetical protein FKN15_020819 [Acipenser sinensis]